MLVPASRGPIGDALRECLTQAGDTARLAKLVKAGLLGVDDVLTDGDLQLVLFTLYELHYTGFEDADGRFEWDVELLRARALIEARFEAELRQIVPLPPLPEPAVDAVAAALFELTKPIPGPSLSRYVAKKATEEQLRDFMIQRSLYTLKEADPHTWAIPRLKGRPKAALVEVQTDEYGNGRPTLMHSAIFAQTMRQLGLEDDYGHYVESVSAITIASLNMMSMFGLHRRLRGAAAGHLAAFEMTSSIPSRFYGDGFRRLGFGPAATLYFDEHVEADAVHEQIAGRDLAGALAEDEPQLLEDILFGAAACLYVDGLAGDHILTAWTNGHSSLEVHDKAPAPEATGHTPGCQLAGHYHG